MTQEDWDYCSKKAIELFSFGQKTALENGMILVDTKYEMGKDSNGKIVLIDDAEYLSRSASHSLLKIIEEPNTNVQFILIYDSSRYYFDSTYGFNDKYFYESRHNDCMSKIHRQ